MFRVALLGLSSAGLGHFCLHITTTLEVSYDFPVYLNPFGVYPSLTDFNENDFVCGCKLTVPRTRCSVCLGGFQAR
jgi:hypothetical protein